MRTILDVILKKKPAPLAEPFLRRPPMATLHDEARKLDRLFPVQREARGTHGGPVGRPGKKGTR